MSETQAQAHDAEHHPEDTAKPAGDAERPDEKDQGAEKPEKAKKSLLQRPVLLIALIAGVIAAAIGGFLYWQDASKYESTDDAFVDGNIVHVAPRASGEVLTVAVVDNQRVVAGQFLVQIDDALARNQIAQARASRASALSQIEQARAQVGVSNANADQARADVIGPTVQATRAERDYQRYLAVKAMNPGAVAQQQIDTAQATAANNAAQRLSALQRVRSSLAQVSSARTQIGAGGAQLQTAAAQEDQARLQVGFARIVAPVTGHIAHKTIAAGNYVQMGQEVLSIVPDDLWITANFKETQLQHVRTGQAVEVRIDAYPGVKFEGRIDSIQRGAGQSFSVLPAQNATGNYVKVVQRVPVKIVLVHPDPKYPLGPGMSVRPRVRIVEDR